MKTNSYPLISTSLTVALLASMTLAIPHSWANPSSHAKVTIMPDIPGALDLLVVDINNQGQVIGLSFDSEYNPSGFVYANGVYTSLDFLPSRINERGQIVGAGLDANSEIQSFVYEKGSYTGISFPGALAGSTFVSGVNNQGQVIGTYNDSDGTKTHGFIYDKGGYTGLPDVAGAQLTLPQSINNAGLIVGWSYDSTFESPPGFVLDKGVYTVLNGPGAVNGTFLTDVNSLGQIVGIASDSEFNTHSFVYEKVPTPASTLRVRS